MVITDCAMPVMSGVELIRRIRQRESRAHRRTVVVALTANAMHSQRDECFAAGADEVFIKPIDPENLRALLERYAIMPARMTGLESADILPEPHADLWERLRRTLAAEVAALLSLSIENERDEAKQIVHRIAGAAAWFQLEEVAQAAARLEMRLANGGASHADLFALRTAIARATGESATTGSEPAASEDDAGHCARR
jgi:CheY-like chemotaxis protein